MGYLLFFIALILSIILYPIGFLYTLFSLSLQIKLRRAFEYLEKIFHTSAILIDIMGNVFMRYLFNDLLLKKGAHPFGSHKETVSKVLGINKAKGKLTFLGRLLADFLNLIDKHHVEKAVENEW